MHMCRQLDMPPCTQKFCKNCITVKREISISPFARLQIYEWNETPGASQSVSEGKIVRTIRTHDKSSQIADFVGRLAGQNVAEGRLQL